MLKYFFLILLSLFLFQVLLSQTTNKQDLHSNALHFDGIDDYIEVTTNKFLTPKEITIELWAKSNTEYWNSTGSLISKRECYIMHPVFDTKTIQFIIFGKDFSYNIEYNPDIELTSWHHYAASYNGKTIKLYINGQLVSSGKNRRSEKVTGKIENLFIGTDDKMEGRYFNGSIDELRIWNYARTQRNIMRTMNLELSGNEKGLIAYYSFNQGIAGQPNSSETILKDLTEKNNGKLYNFSLSGDTSNWTKSGARIIGGNTGSDLINNILSPINFLIVLSIIIAGVIFMLFRSERQKEIQKYLEQQVAEKTQELVEENKIKDGLISEIHHRVKNNLQTISSLIYFQIKTIDKEEKKSGLRSIQTRIDSMSALHEMLYSNDEMAEVSMKEFISDFLNFMTTMFEKESGRIKINAEIDDVHISASKSIAVGLMISEVISNSIKHAFKNTTNPQINIEVSSSNSDISLKINDNGCGADMNILENNDKSLGYKLINIFARQLEAGITVKNNNGLQYCLIFRK